MPDAGQLDQLDRSPAAAAAAAWFRLWLGCTRSSAAPWSSTAARRVGAAPAGRRPRTGPGRRRPPAEQAGGRAPPPDAELDGVGVAQVQHPGQRHRGPQPDLRGGARCAGRQSGPGGQPERQWPPAECPTATMRSRSSTPPVDPGVRKSVYRGGGVGEGAGPAAAVLTDPPVLDVPGRVPAARQVPGQRVHQVAPVRGAPEPAVHQYHHRVRPRSRQAGADRRPAPAPARSAGPGSQPPRVPQRQRCRRARRDPGVPQNSVSRKRMRRVEHGVGERVHREGHLPLAVLGVHRRSE